MQRGSTHPLFPSSSSGILSCFFFVLFAALARLVLPLEGDGVEGEVIPLERRLHELAECPDGELGVQGGR